MARTASRCVARLGRRVERLWTDWRSRKRYGGPRWRSVALVSLLGRRAVLILVIDDGNPVRLRRPRAEVDLLAALRTEWAERRRRRPLDGLAALRTTDGM